MQSSPWCSSGSTGLKARSTTDVEHLDLLHAARAETYVHVGCMRSASVATYADRQEPVQTLARAAARDSRCSQLRFKLLAHRALNPPPSSSLAEVRTPPLAPCTLLAPLAEAGAHWPLPSSLARRRRTCLLARSFRTAARQPGSVRRRAIPDARSSVFKLLAHRALNPPPSSSLAEVRTPPLAPCTLLAPLAEAGAHWPLPSSLARRRRTCLLARSSRTAARQPGSVRRCAIPDARSFRLLACDRVPRPLRRRS
jgi:hypothetical protein